MTTTEEHLGRFYIELQAWIDGGCARHVVFNRKRGLCLAIDLWSVRQKGLKRPYLVAGLKRQFTDANLSPDFPFDDSHSAFIRSVNASEHYTNPARLAWIKEHAEAAKAAGLAVAS